jgi:hypothetical protein
MPDCQEAARSILTKFELYFFEGTSYAACWTGWTRTTDPEISDFV